MKDHDKNRCWSCIAFAMAVIASFPIHAEEWDVTESGNVRASLTNGILTISGNGRMADLAKYSSSNYPPWYDVVTQAVIKTGVKNVGKRSLAECDKLKEVILESGVEEISAGAFGGCDNLANVRLNEDLKEIGETAFNGCGYRFKDIVIPNSVTNIGKNAFRQCSALNHIAFPRQLAELPEYVCRGCISLEDVVLPEQLTELYVTSAFYGCPGITITIPSTVTNVAPWFVNDGVQSFTSRMCLNFLGTPPQVSGSMSVDGSHQCRYSSEYATEWEKVIVDGKWNGIPISEGLYYPHDGGRISNGVLSISYEYMRDYAEGAQPWVLGKERIRAAKVDARKIGANMCRAHSSLGSVELSSRVAKIGTDAFAECEAISNVVIRCGSVPDGCKESKLFANYPKCTFLIEDESAWMDEIAALSEDLVVVIGNETNEIVKAGSSKTILMSCDVEKASIYYTLDGTEPTTNSAKYTTKFKVKPQGKMTIKASAIIDRWPYHSVQSITLALGKCETPTASMVDEEVFYESNHPVSLATKTDECVIRYTLDGSEPTESSTVYAGPIVISETTTIKAKAFRDDYFESETMTVRLVRGWHQVETPTVRAETNGVATATFAGSHAWVNLSCETEGAVIHYTADGSDPTEDSPVYTQPFKVFESATVKALAVKDDWLDSAVAEYEITKTYGIGDVMKDPDTTFVQDAVYPWTEDGGTAAFGESSMQSGAADDYEASVLLATVTGSGRVLFRWKANCEEDVYDHEFDHGEFRVDGVEATDRIDGMMTNWKAEDVRVDGAGDHSLEWIYQKDDADEKSYDGGRIWVDGFVWIPDNYSRTTQRTTAAVPHNWLYGYGLLANHLPETAAAGVTGKRDSTGRALTVEDDYVAGTDPTNLTSVFSASIEMTNGVPYVTWTPDLNEDGAKALRSYQIWGSTNLVNGGDWECPTNAMHRFFRVTVEMP